MTDYKGKVIDTCSDCGKRGPMWSGMPYRCKGCSDKMSKSNDIFEKAWFSINKEGDPEVEWNDCLGCGYLTEQPDRWCSVQCEKEYGRKVVKMSPPYIFDEASCCDRPRFIERKDGSMRCRTCQKSKISKGSKPDYLDFDEDGDKKEPMKNALKNKKVEKGMGGCSVCKGGALPCIGKNVMTPHGIMCNNQVLDMRMG